jgi:hypothetical protein
MTVVDALQQQQKQANVAQDLMARNRQQPLQLLQHEKQQDT